MNSSTRKAVFSSKTYEWATSQDVYDKLHAEFGFTLDTAANDDNAKCKNYYTLFNDGLSHDWNESARGGAIWCNPPYGRSQKACKPKCTKKNCLERGWHLALDVAGVDHWVRKAVLTAANGTTVVMLLPVRTDTQWWHEYVDKHATEVRFVRGRLTFGAARSPAPFPSVVVVFKGARNE